MRICLVANSLRAGGGLVVGLNFIKTLKDVAPEYEYLIVVPSEAGYEQIELPEKCRVYYHSSTGKLSRYWFEFITLPRLIKKFNPSVIFGMSSVGLFRPPAPQAIWIQSAYFVYPRQHFPRERLSNLIQIYLARLHLRIALLSTKLVFCQTPIIKEKLAHNYHFPLEKIEILPNSLKLEDSQEIEGEAAPEILVNKTKFSCLILTKYYTHKNPNILLDIYKDDEPSKLLDIRFFVTVDPSDHPGAKRFLEFVKNNNLQENIINVGPIPHSQLGRYYENIDLLIMPTTLESFSITYFEAMYFGVPILTTDFDFSRYICGDAALYYNSKDNKDFIAKLMMLKSSKELRKELAQKGHEQLKKFSYSWKDMVKGAFESLERISK